MLSYTNNFAFIASHAINRAARCCQKWYKNCNTMAWSRSIEQYLCALSTSRLTIKWWSAAETSNKGWTKEEGAAFVYLKFLVGKVRPKKSSECLFQKINVKNAARQLALGIHFKSALNARKSVIYKTKFWGLFCSLLPVLFVLILVFFLLTHLNCCRCCFALIACNGIAFIVV